MPRANAATRSDLQSFMDQGRNSQRKTVDRESTTRGEVNEKGRGVVVRKAARSVATRRNAGARMPS